MTHDPKNVRRWLAILADHYPSLLVSGVSRNALAEIERLAGVGYAMSHEHRAHIAQMVDRSDREFAELLDAKARLAIATEALERIAARGPAIGCNPALMSEEASDALAKIKEMK
jgi:anti-sigma-K factor RskA